MTPPMSELGATVYLIRHAEKPSGTSLGFDESGQPDQESLVPQGWLRAGALAAWFSGGHGGVGCAGVLAPDRIYAANSEKHHGTNPGSKSKRPMQTIAALAGRLGLRPNLNYTKGEEELLGRELAELDGTTLVCWQHEDLVAVVQAVAADIPGAPSAWPDSRYDVLWTLTRDSGVWSFTQSDQRLLAGDLGIPV